jgi:hypothetical protein
MIRTAAAACAVALALSLATGCNSASSPTSPSATRATTLEAFTGAWTSRGVTSTTALPGGCTQLDYQVAQSADGRTATVVFNGTCAGVTASGSGSGTLAGETLTWSAQGTASAAGITCPFAFTNSTASRVGDGLKVDYSGTVCGLAVKGSEVLTRP